MHELLDIFQEEGIVIFRGGSRDSVPGLRSRSGGSQAAVLKLVCLFRRQGDGICSSVSEVPDRLVSLQKGCHCSGPSSPPLTDGSVRGWDSGVTRVGSSATYWTCQSSRVSWHCHMAEGSLLGSHFQTVWRPSKI